MRILIAHEAAAGGGGVESYLASLMPALAERGHQLAFLHHNRRSDQGPTRLDVPGVPSAGVMDEGLEPALDLVRAWRPDVCFSHNMGPLDVDAALAREWPTVKMMHGYFGTCIGGQKAHAFPAVQACARTFGPACLAHYLPRHCGQRRPARMLQQYSWATRQRALFAEYAHVVVASAHMAEEYRRHGIASDRLTVAPLFATVHGASDPRPQPATPTILFAGRMTTLKGGDVLIEAAARTSRQLGQQVRLVMAGDGPERERWRVLAGRLQVAAEFTGWLTADALAMLFRRASIVAVPSRWPEPFGLVGLEAAVHGVPAVGFDAGGIGEWLCDDVNGRLVAAAGGSDALGDAMAAVLGAPGELRRLGDGAIRVAGEMSVDAHLDIIEAAFARAAQARPVFA